MKEISEIGTLKDQEGEVPETHERASVTALIVQEGGCRPVGIHGQVRTDIRLDLDLQF